MREADASEASRVRTASVPAGGRRVRLMRSGPMRGSVREGSPNGCTIAIASAILGPSMNSRLIRVLLVILAIAIGAGAGYLLKTTDTVTPQVLVDAGLVKRKTLPIKILGSGEVGRPIIVQAHKFSRAAMEKIQAAGGRAEVIGGV